MDQQHTDTPAAPPSWEQRLEHLQQRQLPEVDVIIRDDAAEVEVADRLTQLADARIVARQRLRKAPADPETSPTPIDALIEADEAVTVAREAYEAATVAALAAAITFRFRALPPHAYEALAAQHPPTDAQDAEGHRVNPDTYTAALISACSVFPLPFRTAYELIHGALVDPLPDNIPDTDPRVTDLTADRTDPPLNTGEAALLFHACREINERPGSTIMGKGLGPTSS